jgi:hypothetical protein
MKNNKDKKRLDFKFLNCKCESLTDSYLRDNYQTRGGIKLSSNLKNQTDYVLKFILGAINSFLQFNINNTHKETN